ncbi:YEATS-associated helix-containing protein [Larkinella bovis]|uniref:YEATS-associated helix-containing protein n=1 Tax=Larkinella bovis TaxID=683041 RepID=A0ABW0IF33_9BACT
MNSVLASPDLWTILGAMTLAGLVGGLVNCFLPAAEGEPTKVWWKCVLMGIGASLIVPVFLFLTQSKILDELVKVLPAPPASGATDQPLSVAIGQKVQNYLVFFSFCTIAAISSTRFISSVSDRLMIELKKEVRETKEQVQETQKDVRATQQQVRETDQKVEETEKKTTTNRATLQAVKKKIQENSIARKTAPTNAVPITREATRGPSPAISSPLHPDDPQKGRWGGKHTVNFRQLQATVTAIDDDEDWFNVRMEVISTDPQHHPLTGNVIFHLHDTFVPDRQSVPVVNNRAVLEKTAWGAFTIGAETDDGTQLELDLSDPTDAPDVPAVFRAR